MGPNWFTKTANAASNCWPLHAALLPTVFLWCDQGVRRKDTRPGDKRESFVMNVERFLRTEFVLFRLSEFLRFAPVDARCDTFSPPTRQEQTQYGHKTKLSCWSNGSQGST